MGDRVPDHQQVDVLLCHIADLLRVEGKPPLLNPGGGRYGLVLCFCGGVGGVNLSDPLRHFSAASPDSSEEPTQVEAPHFPAVTLGEQVNPAFTLRAGTARVEGRVGKGTFGDEALQRPGLAAVETGPDRSMVAASGALNVAEDEDVLVLDGQSHEAAHQAITGIARTVRQVLAHDQILPGHPAIVTHGGPAGGVVIAFRHPVSAGIVINSSVRQLGNRGFACSVGGKGFTG